VKKPLYGIFKILYDHYGPQYWWPAETPFEVMVGAVLTQNTNWRNVEKAINNLKRAGALSSPKKILSMPERKLAALIRPAGYFNIKAKRLKSMVGFYVSTLGVGRKIAGRLKTKRFRDELLSVNGIGPETADSILLYSFGRRVFVVDAYTRRIFSRHGYFASDLGYEHIRRLFEESLPPDAKLYNEYHALIVRLGKDFCRTVPKCELCPLSHERK